MILVYNNWQSFVSTSQRVAGGLAKVDRVLAASQKPFVVVISLRRVSDRTRIVSAPPSEVVASSTDDVTIRCDATTDDRRSSHLHVTWYRNELPVSQEGRVRITDAGSRLVIENSVVSDGGTYKCTASNGIDEDSATVIVTIKGMAYSCTVCTETLC